MTTPAPAPTVHDLPRRRERRSSSSSTQLRLPGATTTELVIVAVVIADVRIVARDGLGGVTARAQAKAALLMGGRVELGRVQS